MLVILLADVPISNNKLREKDETEEVGKGDELKWGRFCLQVRQLTSISARHRCVSI